MAPLSLPSCPALTSLRLLLPRYGNTWIEGKWVGTSQYSHGTGFINFGGWDPSGRDFTLITNITRVRPAALCAHCATASLLLLQCC